MTFLTLCLIPEHWMGSRVQWTVDCFPQLYFLQFFLAQVLVGLRKKLINNFVFPTWACAAGVNNNNNNNISNTATKLYLDTTTYLNKTETCQPGKTTCKYTLYHSLWWYIYGLVDIFGSKQLLNFYIKR